MTLDIKNLSVGSTILMVVFLSLIDASVINSDVNIGISPPSTNSEEPVEDGLALFGGSNLREELDGNEDINELVVESCAKSFSIGSPLCRLISRSFPGIFVKPINEGCYNDTLKFIGKLHQRKWLINYIQDIVVKTEVSSLFVNFCKNYSYWNLDNNYCVGNIIQNPLNSTIMLIETLPNLGAFVSNTFIGNESVKLSTHQLCVPSICRVDDIREGLHIYQLLQRQPHSMNTAKCFKSQKAGMVTSTLISIIFTTFLFLVIQISCSLCEEYLKKRKQDALLFRTQDKFQTGFPKRSVLYVPDEQFAHHRFIPRLIKALSLSGNVKKLFSLKCRTSIIELHGIRVLSMLWLSLGTSFLLCLLHPGSNNSKLAELMSSGWFQPIMGSSAAIETYFILSGLLMGYVLWNSNQMEGVFTYRTLISYFIKRYIRLGIPLSLLLLVMTSISFPSKINPYLDVFERLNIIHCQKKWWTNLVFIQNAFRVNEGMCLPHTWYIACDLQMTLVALILLTCAGDKRIPNNQGLLCLAVMAAIALVVPVFIIEIFGLSPGLIFNRIMSFKFMKDYYILPYSHFFEYLSGLWLGIFIAGQKAPRKMRISYLIVSWTVWVLAATYRIMGMYLYNLYPDSPPRRYETGFVNLMQRLSWVFVVLWIVYVTVSNQADMLKRFLGHKLFIPLSKISYTFYLVGFPIQSFYLATLDHPPEVTSILHLVVYNCGVVGLTLIISLTIHLVVAAPIKSTGTIIMRYFNKDPSVKKPWKGKVPVIVLDPVDMDDSLSEDEMKPDSLETLVLGEQDHS